MKRAISYWHLYQQRFSFWLFVIFNFCKCFYLGVHKFRDIPKHFLLWFSYQLYDFYSFIGKWHAVHYSTKQYMIINYCWLILMNISLVNIKPVISNHLDSWLVGQNILLFDWILKFTEKLQNDGGTTIINPIFLVVSCECDVISRWFSSCSLFLTSDGAKEKEASSFIRRNSKVDW